MTMAWYLFFSLLLLCNIFPLRVLAQECSVSKPCAEGCCSKDGFCGLGPDACAPSVCVGNCDRKSECDPGWGLQWSAAEGCPLNVCCSKFGYCGTTTEFCGDTFVKSPSCSGTSASRKTIAYYETWAVGRSCDAMWPEQIPAAAYSHINIAFALIDPNSFQVASMGDQDADLYRRVVNLKTSNSGLQVWISLGGWSMNDPDQPTRTTFSDLVGSTSNQAQFFQSLIQFMQTYGLDGVDIDWEYPVAPERSGSPVDFANFPTFLSNMRQAFQNAGHNYGVTITLPSSYWYMRNFDIKRLDPQVDWFNMMTYDIHGTWDASDVYIGPYVKAHTNLTEIDEALKLLWRNNVDPSKVVLGLGFYGRSFTLQDPSCNTAGCLFTDGAAPGPCTAESGTLSYSEIQSLIAAGAQPILDREAAVQTLVYGGNNWVSYDDVTTLKMKIDYANKNCLGGTMVWAASLDDPQGSAAAALSGVTGLQKIHVNLAVAPSDPRQSCVWSNCGASCPAGYSPAAMSGGGLTMIDRRCSSGQLRSFCCPNNDIPTCHWGNAGFGPICATGCTNNYIDVAHSSSNCWMGSQSLCCAPTKSDILIGQCHWTGSAPLCVAGPNSNAHAGCDSGNSEVELAYSSRGDGGENFCLSGWKSFCCKPPVPYKNCAWYRNGGQFTFLPFVRAGTCPAGQTLLSLDNSHTGCIFGDEAFCCDPPSVDTSVSPPPNGVAAVWDGMVQTFLKNPTCQMEDPFASPRDLYQRRSLETPSILWKLNRRSASSNSDSWAIAAFLAPVLLNQASAVNILLAQIWDSFIAAAGTAWQNLTSQTIRAWLQGFTNEDPVFLLSELLCAGEDAGLLLRQMNYASTDLCQCPGTLTRRSLLEARSLSLRGELELLNNNQSVSIEDKPNVKRGFGGAASPNALPSELHHVPQMGYALEAIRTGNARFEYYSWFRYATGQAGGQMELEAAYLLGPDPSHLNPDLQQRTDDVTLPRMDRFMVLHFHFQRFRQNGENRFGIIQINLRHGSQMRSTTNSVANTVANAGRFRVQQQEAHGARVLTCPPNRGWCPATLNTPPPNPPNPPLGDLAGLILDAVTQSIPIHVFSEDTNPDLPPGVDFDNGNWGAGAQSTRGLTLNADGHSYNPYDSGLSVNNGFIATDRYS